MLCHNFISVAVSGRDGSIRSKQCCGVMGSINFSGNGVQLPHGAGQAACCRVHGAPGRTTHSP